MRPNRAKISRALVWDVLNRNPIFTVNRCGELPGFFSPVAFLRCSSGLLFRPLRGAYFPCCLDSERVGPGVFFTAKKQ